MSVDTEQRPVPVEQPAQRPTALPTTEKPGLEDRGGVLVAGVLVFAVLVFAAMVALTVLAGGDGYPH
ncbi:MULTISPECIES: hypothetical protein [unclassified Modestobacter]